ncbi:MAG TPA: hypothetical protein PKA05_18530 [Roseiflexaceae bacterium]|nr:hypothetical protein [Roseiflexaceae bacterium]HMP42381.1 hypothetical protein [Roseiflexaceae bacterium]
MAAAWNRRFETILAILIALVTVMSAVAAWRAAIAGDAAGNADFDGLSAAISYEEARALNASTSYQQYRAYTRYLLNNTLGDLLWDDGQQASAEEASILRRDRLLAYDQMLIDVDFFESRYINRDGAYDRDRQFDALMADSERNDDLNPLPHFQEADRQYTKSRLQIAMLIFLASALWFFTLAAEIKHVIRYPLATLGLMAMCVAIVGSAAIEFF